MARDVDSLLLRKWAADPSALTETPESEGLDRSVGFPAPYGIDEFVPLQVWNKIWKEITGSIYEMYQRGIPEWHTLQTYLHPCNVVGSDGEIYESTNPSGDPNPSQDPTTDTSHAYWQPFLFDLIASATQIEAGSSDSLLVSPDRLESALFKNNVNSRWRASDGQYGLAKLAGQTDYDNQNSGPVVDAALLYSILSNFSPPMTVPVATTVTRGISRRATEDEADDGTASSPHMTPELTQRVVEAGNGRILASDISLTARTRITQALSSPLNDFRWIEILAGDNSDEYGGPYYRVPRSDISAIQSIVGELFTAVTGGDEFHLFSVNPQTGALTEIGDGTDIPNIQGIGIAFHSAEMLALLEKDTGNVQLYVVNLQTGVLTARGSSTSLLEAIGIGLVSHKGKLLAVVRASGPSFQLYEVNPQTGVLTAIGSPTSIPGLGSIGLASNNLTLFAAARTSSGFQLYVVNPQTGVLTAIGSPTSIQSLSGVGITFHSEELLAAFEYTNTSTFQLYVVNPQTGVLTARGNSSSFSFVSTAYVGFSSTSVVTGGALAGNINLDRNGNSSLGLLATEDLYIHQIIGIA